MDCWPYLDIEQALHDCDRNLADILRYVEVLLEGVPDPALTQLHDNVSTLRELLTVAMPAGVLEEVAKEQKAYGIAEGEWEAHKANNYLP